MSNKKISNLNSFTGTPSNLLFVVIEDETTKKGTYGDMFSAATQDNYVNISGDTMTGQLNTPSISANTLSATTYYGDASQLDNLPTTFWSGGSYTGIILKDSGNESSGDLSVAEGKSTVASGNYSHTEGYLTTASGGETHAEGRNTIASGYYSHAEGSQTIASGEVSHVEGFENLSSGYSSHAEGAHSTASGYSSHAEGVYTIAAGFVAHSEGYQTTASGDGSHTEGDGTTASGENSHGEGRYTIASSFNAHAEGDTTLASGITSHAEGYHSTASGSYSHAEGSSTIASGTSSHAEGLQSQASGYVSHAEGRGTIASGDHSHAEGWYTTADGSLSHAEGFQSQAYLTGMHAKSSGKHSSSGKMQYGNITNYMKTSGSTPTIINSATSFIIPINTFVKARVMVIAVDQLTGNIANWDGVFVVTRIGNALSLISETITLIDDNITVGGLSVGVNSTTQEIELTGTGKVGTDIYWTTFVEWVETQIMIGPEELMMEITGANTLEVTLKSGYDYNCVLDWGDGSSTLTIAQAGDGTVHSHTYAGGTSCILTISGLFEAIHFAPTAKGVYDVIGITRILSWGHSNILQLKYVNCGKFINLTTIPIDNTLTNIELIYFNNCTSLTGTAPRFWDDGLYPELTTTTNCFNNTNTIGSSGATIPITWGGSSTCNPITLCTGL